MTSTERLERARGLCSEAFAELEAVTGLDELEAHAVLQLRTELGEIVRRLGNVIVFARKARTS